MPGPSWRKRPTRSLWIRWGRRPALLTCVSDARLHNQQSKACAIVLVPGCDANASRSDGSRIPDESDLAHMALEHATAGA